MVSSGSTTSSIAQSAGEALEARGIVWREQTEEELMTMSNEEFSFDNAWKEFKNVSGSPLTADDAWSYFKSVMEKTHDTEQDFDVALFEALRSALGEAKNESDKTKSNVIILNNERVGFRRQAGRSLTEFPNNYGTSGNCVSLRMIA